MNSYSSKHQNSHKKKRIRRKKEPTSAAQKLLIIICIAALIILVSIILTVILSDNNSQYIDESSSLPNTTSTVKTTTAVRTSVTSVTKTSVSSSAANTTLTAVSTAKNASDTRYRYKTDFTLKLPAEYCGRYSIEIICNNTGKIFTVQNIVIPDMTSVSQELTYLTPDESVSADVYLINTANSKRALIGTADLNFSSSTTDYSKLDAESAFLAVQ